MKKSIFYLIIGLLVLYFTSTASAKITSITLDAKSDTVTFTYENIPKSDDLINNGTDVLVIINKEVICFFNLENSGTSKYRINYDLKKGVVIRFSSLDSMNKHAQDKFMITKNIHAHFYGNF